MELFMILAQACDLGRRHRKARVGDRGHWQELPTVLLSGLFLKNLQRGEQHTAKTQPSPGASLKAWVPTNMGPRRGTGSCT